MGNQSSVALTVRKAFLMVRRKCLCLCWCLLPLVLCLGHCKEPGPVLFSLSLNSGSSLSLSSEERCSRGKLNWAPGPVGRVWGRPQVRLLQAMEA